MKKIIFCVSIFLCALFLIGCDPNEGDDITVITDVEAKMAEIAEWLGELFPEVIYESVDLPMTDQKYDSTITWLSNTPAVIDDDGFVIVDYYVAKDASLDYQITLGGESIEGTISFIVSPVTIDKVEEDFAKQFSLFISRDYNIKTVLYGKYEIDWYTDNEEVFNNTGKYNKPLNDTTVNIYYNVSIGSQKGETKTKAVTVLGWSEVDKFKEASAWLKSEIMTDLYLTNEITLPTKYEKFNMPIEWKSSNPDVVSAEGVIKQYVFERYVTLSAILSVNSYSQTTRFECIVAPLETSGMTKTEIIENFLSAIAVSSYSKIQFAAYGNINQSFGALNFYVNEKSEITEMIMPEGNPNRTKFIMTPKLVVIHDTGNNNNGSTARANANYVYNGYGGSTTGWHYTVGNDGIFHTIPDNEVAYHANGSTSQPLTWINTNIPVTAKKPIITIENATIYINGISTNIVLPETSRNFASDGVLCEIQDGKYYIAKSWYCSSHGFNANQGGNANGIGIESAVNPGSDYLTTCRILAKLTAELLIDNGLDINRVVQHNTTSGKNCPQAIRDIYFWYTFKDMVSMEKFAKENLANCTFTWTSNSNVLNNEGKISLQLNNATSVSYNVVVKEGSTVITSKSYTTNLNV